MPATVQKPKTLSEQEELDAIEAAMRAGEYVTLEAWERKNGYSSQSK